MSTVLDKKTFIGYIKERYLLNGQKSTKKTYHIVLGHEDDFPYKVGDSIGIYPTNDPHLVDAILDRLQADSNQYVQEKKTKEFLPLGDFLLYRANLSKVSSSCLSFLKVEKEEGPCDLLDYLEKVNHPVDAKELCLYLLPQLPRFYSIASSPLRQNNQIDLTVSYLQDHIKNRVRYGVASHFLCTLAQPSTPIPFFLFPSKGFTLPKDSSAHVIMVGPGTGIAPFRAFLLQRQLQKATGKNWLFFGERNKEYDFYYQKLFTDLQKDNFLRLSTAFSQDQQEKIYVQHRLQENSKEIWQWLKEGAYFYVCGDAKKMAKAVHQALLDIVIKEEKLSLAEAKHYLKKLKETGRYLLDVY